jgi:hypothetical protein
LDTLNLASLASLGDDTSSGILTISDTKLTELNLDTLTQVNLGILQVSRNPNLSQCAASALVSRFSGSGFDGTPFIDSNAACARCAGSVCAQ